MKRYLIILLSLRIWYFVYLYVWFYYISEYDLCEDYDYIMFLTIIDKYDGINRFLNIEIYNKYVMIL